MKKTYTLYLDNKPVYVREENNDFEFTWKTCKIIIDREEKLVMPAFSCKEEKHGDTKKLFDFAYDHAHEEHVKKKIILPKNKNKPSGKGANTYETRWFRNYEV